MRIAPAEPSDWQAFLQLASKEGWRVPELEGELFAGPWARYALALRVGDRFQGLVTAVPHQLSGWIGNLIVPASARGKGYGRRLFEAALELLQTAGVARVWLTASALGRPLYEGYGFMTVDQVERWVRPAGSPGMSAEVPLAASALLRSQDLLAWGENRSELLRQLLLRGEVLAVDDTVALLQRGRQLQQLGPWYSESRCPRANRQLLQQLLARLDPAVETVADLLVSSPVRQLLAAAGFAPAGRNELMIRGGGTADLHPLVALASLGSLG